MTTLPARLDPVSTALLVVDMQNGFCHPQGTLARAGVDVQAPIAVVPNVVRLVNLCRSAGVRVIWTQQEHRHDDRSKQLHSVPTHLAYLDTRGLTLCGKDDPDAGILAELQAVMRREDDVVHKHKFSAFYCTNLETLLRQLGVRTLLVAGVNTNVCVESTVRDAYARDYDVIVVEECVAGPSQRLHEATLENVRLYFGAVARLEEVASALSAPAETSAARSRR